MNVIHKSYGGEMTDQEQQKIVRLKENVGKHGVGTWALLRWYVDDYTVELAFVGDSKWHQAATTAIDENVPEDEIPKGLVFGA